MRTRRVASSSAVQQRVERLVIAAFGESQGVRFKPRTIDLEGCKVRVDGYYWDPDRRRVVLVEAWAHVGKAAPAQVKKVLTDVLKLTFVSTLLKLAEPALTVDMYLLFVDDVASRVLDGKSWGAAAARKFGIVPHVVRLDQELLAEIQAAQKRQDIRYEVEG